MKFKHIMVGFLASATLALGVGAGVAMNHVEAKEAGAKAGDVTYCLAGSFTNWVTNQIDMPSDGTNIGVLLNQSMSAGDTFKIKLKDTWDNSLNFTKFNTACGAYDAFGYNDGDDNIRVGATGRYNIYVYNDSGTDKISIEFADGYDATYSYFLTSDSGFGQIYLWNGKNKLREWGSSHGLDGQANDIKFVYSGYTYYGVYRVDDRILNGWPSYKLKSNDGSKQTGDLSRTSGNKQEAYLLGATNVTKVVTSDEYKAIEFLYNLVADRGIASYEGHNLAYSICHTDPTKAETLVNTYDGFSASIKTILGDAQFRVYKVDVIAEIAEENKEYADIVDIVNALRVVASRKGSGLMNFAEPSVQDSTIIIIALATSISLIVVASFFAIRRRKEQE